MILVSYVHTYKSNQAGFSDQSSCAVQLSPACHISIPSIITLFDSYIYSNDPDISEMMDTNEVLMIPESVYLHV